jgi:hypothetical protein
MPLSKIQKTFIRLATSRKRSWLQSPYRWPRRRRVKIFEPKTIKVKIINAVTGEETTARAQEDSAAKLKKWLRLRNIRAEFTKMLIKKNSTWSKLKDNEFEDFPIIVKVGTYKTPYVIRHVEDRVTKKGKTTVTILLETTDNIDFLGILSLKKELLEKSKKK